MDLDPKSASACHCRAEAYYAQRNWTNALADMRHCCELNPTDRDYYQFEIWLIRTRLNEADAASKELAAYMDKRTGGPADDWPAKIAGFLLDKISDSDFLAAAASTDPTRIRGSIAKRQFYCGMKHLLAGDQTTATEYFKKCLTRAQSTYRISLGPSRVGRPGQIDRDVILYHPQS